MALIRPGCGEEESGSREWRHPNPLANQRAKAPLTYPAHHMFRKSAPRKPGTPSDTLTCVVQVPRPLVVVGLLGEHGLGHQLLRLVVQVIVQVVSQQEVQQGGLPVGIVPEGGRPEPSMQETSRKKEKRCQRPQLRMLRTAFDLSIFSQSLKT